MQLQTKGCLRDFVVVWRPCTNTIIERTSERKRPLPGGVCNGEEGATHVVGGVLCTYTGWL